MDSPNLISGRKKTTKSCITFWTVIYLLLFLPCLGMTLCGSLISYEQFSFGIGLTYVVLFFSILLSLPASIYLMWSNYRKGQYQRAHFSYALPLLMIMIEFLFEAITRIF